MVIAEGVETEDALGFLGALGSHERRGGRVQAVQGYLLGKPLELPAALPEVGILR